MDNQTLSEAILSMEMDSQVVLSVPPPPLPTRPIRENPITYLPQEEDWINLTQKPKKYTNYGYFPASKFPTNPTEPQKPPDPKTLHSPLSTLPPEYPKSSKVRIGGPYYDENNGPIGKLVGYNYGVYDAEIGDTEFKVSVKPTEFVLIERKRKGRGKAKTSNSKQAKKNIYTDHGEFPVTKLLTQPVPQSEPIPLLSKVRVRGPYGECDGPIGTITGYKYGIYYIETDETKRKLVLKPTEFDVIPKKRKGRGKAKTSNSKQAKKNIYTDHGEFPVTKLPTQPVPQSASHQTQIKPTTNYQTQIQPTTNYQTQINHEEFPVTKLPAQPVPQSASHQTQIKPTTNYQPQIQPTTNYQTQINHEEFPVTKLPAQPVPQSASHQTQIKPTTNYQPQIQPTTNYQTQINHEEFPVTKLPAQPVPQSASHQTQIKPTTNYQTQINHEEFPVTKLPAQPVPQSASHQTQIKPTANYQTQIQPTTNYQTQINHGEFPVTKLPAQPVPQSASHQTQIKPTTNYQTQIQPTTNYQTQINHEEFPVTKLPTQPVPQSASHQTQIKPTTNYQTQIQPTTNYQTQINHEEFPVTKLPTQPVPQSASHQTQIKPTTNYQTQIQPTTNYQTQIQPTTNCQTLINHEEFPVIKLPTQPVSQSASHQTQIKPTTNYQTQIQPTTNYQTQIQPTTNYQTQINLYENFPSSSTNVDYAKLCTDKKAQKEMYPDIDWDMVELEEITIYPTPPAAPIQSSLQNRQQNVMNENDGVGGERKEYYPLRKIWDKNEVPKLPYKYDSYWTVPKQVISKLTNSSYTFTKYIGKGAYGYVFEAKNDRTGLIHGCKIQPVVSDETLMNLVYNEINLQRTTEHPNVVRLFDGFQYNTSVCLVMEHCINDSLTYFCRNTIPSLRNTKYFTKQLLSGLAYLHSVEIAHWDVKPENILLDINMNVKLCDFGLGYKMKTSTGPPISMVGSPNYISPEMITGIDPQSDSCDKSDVWSAGVCIAYLLTGREPFCDYRSDKATYANILALNWKYSRTKISKKSKDAVDLLKKIFVKVDQRLSAIECLNHSFLEDAPGIFQYAD